MKSLSIPVVSIPTIDAYGLMFGNKTKYIIAEGNPPDGALIDSDGFYLRDKNGFYLTSNENENG